MSDGINFHEQIEQLLGFGTADPVSPSTNVNASSQTQEDSSTSTISKVQMEDDAKKAIWPGSAPMLITPNYMQVIMQTQKDFEEMKHDIISDMLDKWSDSLKEMTAEDRKKFEHQIKLGLDKLFNAYIIPSANGPTTIQDVYKLELGRVDQADRGALDSYSFIGLGMSVLMINALSVIAGPSAQAIGVAQPGMKLMGALAGSDVVPKSLDASLRPDILSQLSALLLLPSFYPAMAKAVGLLKFEPKANLEQEFALQFLKQNILLAKSGDFSEFLKVIAQTIPKAAQAGTKHQELLLFTAKMMLLLSSLALFYKIETGGLTGAELKGMVTGEMKLPPGDPRLEAVGLINELLKSVKLPDKEVSVMMEAFYQYFDGDPNYADLLDPLETMKILNQDLSVPKSTMQAI